MFDCCTGPREQDFGRGGKTHGDDSLLSSTSKPAADGASRGVGNCVCVRACVRARAQKLRHSTSVPDLQMLLCLPDHVLCYRAGLSFKAEAMTPWGTKRDSNTPRTYTVIPSHSPPQRGLPQGSMCGVGIVFDTGNSGSGPQGDGLVVASEFFARCVRH